MYVPLGSTPSYFISASICLYFIVGNYKYARSWGGRHPAAANSPLYTNKGYLCSTSYSSEASF